MVKAEKIIEAIEIFAPPALQESWDNSGLQTGRADRDITGVLTALEISPAVIDEAIQEGCNMIVCHHPMIFKGLKHLTGSNVVERNVEMAIRNGICVYSAHTSLDSAEGGVSYLIADRLGAKVKGVLMPSAHGEGTGLGLICEYEDRPGVAEFLRRVKDRLGLEVMRTSNPDPVHGDIHRFAVCGGAGHEFIGNAIRSGCQAYVTGDIKHHDFLDYAEEILLVDCGHYETEMFARRYMADRLREKFPELKIIVSQKENNPVKYIY